MAIEYTHIDGTIYIWEKREGLKSRGDTKKYQLFEREWGCEHLDCDEINPRNLTVDHITPIRVALELGWSRKRINHSDNLQLLCQKHHILKDKMTSKRAQQLRQQKAGRFISLGEHEIEDQELCVA